MKHSSSMLAGSVFAGVAVLFAACGGSGQEDAHGAHSETASHADDHSHEGGDDHADDHEHADEDGHANEPIGTVRIGDLDVELAQGHGGVAPGKESHLVVRLPYSDGGDTVVRAWIGTQDRTLSYVGKGEFTASHGDYDVHATAPDPLPENPLWWIEIQRPDGTKLLGSAEPLTE